MSGPAFIAVRERGFVAVVPVGDKKRPAGESSREARVERGIGYSSQLMGSSHLIPCLEQLPAAGMIGDQTPDLAVGIPVQKIEWAQVRLHRPQPTEALLSRAARRALVRQDHPL